MSTEGIFLKSGTKLVVLEQRPYDSEAILQEALALYPEVIAGPTTAGDGEGRLLLIRREIGVPSTEGGSNTFSLDHLFVDAEGVPVLVEVKRSTDTRIRREVIGQILDYAANGVRYWPISALRAGLELTAQSANRDPDEMLSELRPDVEPDEFWKAVESNLAAGRIRMLIVADKLPQELVRIIEFLNEQMNPAEVLGVELGQYVGGDHVVYVPSVRGRTTAAIDKKNGSRWNEESFMAAAESRCTGAETALIRQLLSHAKTKGVRLSWGKGVTPGVGGWYQVKGQPTALWVLNVNYDKPGSRPYMYFYFTGGKLTPEKAERAASVLETIPSMKAKIELARSSEWKKNPSLYLADVASSPEASQKVFDAIESLTVPS